MKKTTAAFLLSLCGSFSFAQSDSAKMREAIYQRPFIEAISNKSVSVGGYAEANTNYFAEDGVAEGFSMEMRRFNIFLYSTISPRIKFLSELEFEHGTEEIAIETAMLDFEINPMLVFRGGILLTPIGDFNINHDSPRWEFIERPLVSTEIIPSTLSEVGFGLHGKTYSAYNSFSYYAYVLNGLGDGIILNASGRTSLQEGKHEGRFGEDNNGTPMYAGKVSFRNVVIGELGLSWYGGVYNSFRLDGVRVDQKRHLSLFAMDYKVDIRKLSLRSEFAVNSVEVPSSLSEIYGSGQWGYFAEAVYPLLKRRIATYPNTVLNACLRMEQVDFNTGRFASTGKEIGDAVKALTAGLSLRPTPSTVLKASYRYEWINDAPGNPSVQRAGVQVGLASYF
jgi:hypothetical protein